ncbi:MAG: RtcB family protein [Desulfobacteraceae bacterium]|nr:RtcB family protein [Desulfobacteraceae bacterium]MBU4054077.1 RtcB family protein [Pseudomonadota bacterium]
MAEPLQQISPYCWEIPRTGNMRVPGIIYADAEIMDQIKLEETLNQVRNVACLPGIVKASFAMPDIHWGYGFPIGGVAAFDWDSGVISPGGVGYDINCGVRLATTSLTEEDIRGRAKDLADLLYQKIPSGVGSTGPVKLSRKDLKKVLTQGSSWAVHQGFGEERDIDHTEDCGCMENADPSFVSDRALERGLKQLGTLGSGNHFLEVGVVRKIYHQEAAAAMGFFQGQATLILHSGSRGLGYQICDDFLADMTKHSRAMDFELPDRQLVCAKIASEKGAAYFNAMACAANYAWANRQVLLHMAREIFQRVFNLGPKALNMKLVYDVCHNIAKKETHTVEGKSTVLCVHRKGATRAFGPGHPLVCEDFRSMGQPILVPGDMGTASYVLLGTQKAMDLTFGSTCHGAGRVLSRHAAKKAARGRSIYRELEDRGILVRWSGKSTLVEEMPDAYKNVSRVVNVVHDLGISTKVAKLAPLVVIKG